MMSRILRSALTRATIVSLLPFLLAACLFSREPVLDETNSVSGETSAEFRKFLDTWHWAYSGLPVSMQTHYFLINEGTDQDPVFVELPDLSRIRVAPLENGALLVQQNLDDCFMEHCYVYYSLRMRETWWPESCLAHTERYRQDDLLALGASHDVILSIVNEGDKSPPDFGMEGTQGNLLAFLRNQFMSGHLMCDGDSGVNPLYFAAVEGTAEAVRALIEDGADVNARAWNRATPLHAAASNDAADTIGVLIAAGADIHARDDDGLTPLHMAADFGNIQSVEMLIRAGADVTARDEKGRTPLHKATRGTKPLLVQALIAAGADIHARDDDGLTPLHAAVQEYGSSAGTIEALMTAGADILARDDAGRTPLHIASEHHTSFVDVFAALLAAGADIEARDESGQTPLHHAARSNWSGTVDALVEAGADMSARDESDRTALHIAARDGNAETILALIGAAAEIHARDEKGQTPLHLAAAKGSEESILALLDAGADTSLRDHDGAIPAHLLEHNERIGEGSEVYGRLAKAGQD